MKRRSGITLIEVLVAIFIMAIGLLALLTLFPLAALTMSKALQDDRAATCAYDGANICDSFGVRTDPSIAAASLAATGSTNWSVAYIDPNGVQNQATYGNVGRSNLTTPASPGMMRITAPQTMPSNAGVRFFTLLDDVTFTTGGVPDTTSGVVPRGDRYTWAYLLHNLQPSSPPTPTTVDLAVVVYAARPTVVASGENTYPADGAQNSTSVTLDFSNSPGGQPTIRRGSWILDTSWNLIPPNTQTVSGYFYRVVSVTPAGTTLNLEVETPLLKQMTAVTVLDNVVEVFERGSGPYPK